MDLRFSPIWFVLLIAGSVSGESPPESSATDRDILLFSAIGHSSTVESVDFSPDGRMLASCGLFGLKLWTVAGGVLPRTIEPSARVSAVCFSPTGSLVAGSIVSGPVRVWEVSSSSMVSELNLNTWATDIAFSPDCRLLATATGKVTIWDLSNGREVRSFADEEVSAVRLAFHPSGRIIAAGGGSRKKIGVWEASGVLVFKLAGHANGVAGIAFSPDGLKLASSGADNTVRVWDLNQNGRMVKVFEDLQSTSVAFSNDSRFLYSFGGEKIRIWKVSDWSPVHVINDTPAIRMALSHHEELVALAQGGGQLTVIRNPFLRVAATDNRPEAFSRLTCGELQLSWGQERGGEFQLYESRSVAGPWIKFGNPLIQSIATIPTESAHRFFRVARIIPEE